MPARFGFNSRPDHAVGSVMHSKIFVGLSLANARVLVAGGGGGKGGAATAPPPPSSSVPVITMQPSDQSVSVSQAATFTVTATGAAPLSYQWQKSGSPIAGATASSYTTGATTAADTATGFPVLVPNATATTTSPT